MTESRM